MRKVRQTRTVEKADKREVKIQDIFVTSKGSRTCNENGRLQWDWGEDERGIMSTWESKQSMQHDDRIKLSGSRSWQQRGDWKKGEMKEKARTMFCLSSPPNVTHMRGRGNNESSQNGTVATIGHEQALCTAWLYWLLSFSTMIGWISLFSLPLQPFGWNSDAAVRTRDQLFWGQ